MTAVALGGGKGIALVVTLLAISLLSALALGLALATGTGRLASTNHREAIELLNLAESGLALVLRELDAADDWSAVVDGERTSRLMAPARAPAPLVWLTNDLTCGRPTTCSEVQRRTATAERPWGRDNPRWHLFLATPLSAIASDVPGDGFVAAWTAADVAARGDIVRVRIEAWAARGRRSLEAEVGRAAHAHVRVWRVVTGAAP